MFIRIIVVVIVGFMSLSAAAELSENPALVKVIISDKLDMQRLLTLGLDIPFIDSEGAEVVAYPEDIGAIEYLGLKYRMIHPDLCRYYQSRYPVGTTMGGYRTFSEVLSFIDSLHLLYPSLVSARDSVGYTWQGRAQWVFKISDNVNIDENEPEIFFNALIHAREPQGMEWQLNFARWLCENYGLDPTATDLVNNREIFFMPVVNPDGYEYNRQTNPNGGGMWRKNRRSSPGAVDLNRNWGYRWGYDNVGSSPDPSSETYRGPSAFSEPETQCLRQFINSRHFSVILNAHTYGNYYLYPWGFADSVTPDNDIYLAIADSVVALMPDYTSGTPWQLLYNTNGEANDWQYGEQNEKPLIFAMATESGNQYDGFWPTPSRIPEINAELLPAAILFTQLAENPRSVAPPTAPIIHLRDTVTTDTFTVTWTHNDTANPALMFELVEKTGYRLITDSLERGDGNWQLQNFSLSTARYRSPSHSLYSGDENNYRARAIMRSSLYVMPAETLSFYTSYNIEDGWDYAYVEISTDNGRTFFSIPGNITTNNNPHGYNRGNGITGNQTAWRRATFPLNQYAGTSVIVRFSYETDGGVHNGGIYFDDIRPIPSFTSEVILSSTISDTLYRIQGRQDGSYYYAVRAKDHQLQWSPFSATEGVVVNLSSSIDGDEIHIPVDIALANNYPNPFNSNTVIEFSISNPGLVNLAIYDIAGRSVKNLSHGFRSSGIHKIIWDGKNEDGLDVASGIYFYKIETLQQTIIKPMTLVR